MDALVVFVIFFLVGAVINMLGEYLYGPGAPKRWDREEYERRQSRQPHK